MANNIEKDKSYEFLRPEIGGTKLVPKKIEINEMNDMIPAKDAFFSGLMLTFWSELNKLIDFAPQNLTAEERNNLAGIFYRNIARFIISSEKDFDDFMISRMELNWNL